jgi:hypothetical protein
MIGMSYTYEPINNGAEIMVRRVLGRLTRVINEEALSERDRLPVIHVD